MGNRNDYHGVVRAQEPGKCSIRDLEAPVTHIGEHGAQVQQGGMLTGGGDRDSEVQLTVIACRCGGVPVLLQVRRRAYDRCFPGNSTGDLGTDV